jgi:hypothetical protein
MIYGIVQRDVYDFEQGAIDKPDIEYVAIEQYDGSIEHPRQVFLHFSLSRIVFEGRKEQLVYAYLGKIFTST